MMYTDTLNQLWKDHLAAGHTDAPTVVSTFAGCGGSSLGYSSAGFHELLAVENDKNAIETFSLNFPDVPVYGGDIAQLSVEEALSLTGQQPGELDVLDGSPPCQGFSTAGRREFGDQRNQLFNEFVRLLRGLQPRTFVMENVRGMVVGKMKLTFAQCLRELKASGYHVSARLLNAKYFGVPQSRERLIFIGVRNDLGMEPSHPAPRSRVIPAGEAIADVVNDPAEVEMLLGAGRKYAAFKGWEQLKPGESMSKLSAKGSNFNGIKFHPDKPANTIRKNDGQISMAGAMHWAARRRFTVAEFKRLGSFPDEFQFAGDYSDAVARIGNSVPPLFMKAIAEHVRSNLLEACEIQEAV